MVWLELQRKKSQDFSLQPYENLAAVYKRMGADDVVRIVAVEKQKAVVRAWPAPITPDPLQKISQRQKAKEWGVPKLNRFLKRMLIYACGYGYQPIWAIGWLLLLVSLTTIFFYVGEKAFVPIAIANYPPQAIEEFVNQRDAQMPLGDPDKPGVPAQAANACNADDLACRNTRIATLKWLPGSSWLAIQKQYVEFQPLLHAIDLAVPILDLGSSRYWELGAGHLWLEIWIVLHIIVGHVLIILIAISPTALLRPD